MRRLISVAIVTSAFLSSNALSQETNVDNVNLDRFSLSYNSYNDSEGDTASGGQLSVTTALGKNENWVLGVSARGISYDDFDASGTDQKFSVGYAFYGNNSASIITAGIGNVDVTACYSGYCASGDESYTFTNLTYIHSISENVEYNLNLTLENYSDDSSDSTTYVTLGAGAAFYFNESFSLIGSVSSDDDSNTSVSFGLNYSF